MRLRVGYTEGRIFDISSAEEWKAMPKSGLLGVMSFSDTGRTFFNGGDWYWLVDEKVRYLSSGAWGSDKPQPGGCAVCFKQGVGVTDEEWDAFVIEAMSWR